MSTIAAEALVLAGELKERLRQIANRYLDQQDKLPVSASEEEIIDVLDEYDEYSYMNAFLNSIEVFPDKDYSINDTEGHIKGLRPYAFYNNIALKSANLPAVATPYNSSLFWFDGCSNIETIYMGIPSIHIGSAVGFNELDSLRKIRFNNSIEVYLSYNGSRILHNCGSLKNVNYPKCSLLYTPSGNSSYGGTTYIDTFLIKGGTINVAGDNAYMLRAKAFIITDNENVATCSQSAFATKVADYDVIFYVPSILVSSYASATNWTIINNTRPILDIESHINSLHELGADFSFTPYANKKWENNQLVDDPTIGEEVDE
jgi:hypothetical protein